MADNSKALRCSFCGKTENQVHRMIQGPGVRICDECVHLCLTLLDDGYDIEPELVDSLDQLPTPREIKAVLDEYVVGQEAAKVALSVSCTTTISESSSAAVRMWSCKRATS